MSAQTYTSTRPKSASGKAAQKSGQRQPVDASINKKLKDSQKIDLYIDMVRIRRFEERSLRVYQQGRIAGFLHLYIGQEAIAVATVSLMGENDHIITTYRDHGHALAVGMNMNECMAELCGKAAGCSKGKGGSMHFFAPDKNYWGGHGIVGGQTPLGTGLAFGLKYLDKAGCCVCFMGDGAVNQGAVHESFNLASLWDLPVVYVIENNGYSMGTSESRSSAHPGNIVERAKGYNMDSEFIEGNDIYTIRAVLGDAMEKARSTNRPTLIEMATYRYRGHSVADAFDGTKKYRTKAEVEDYKKNKDPISLWETQLKAENILTDKQIKEIDDGARNEAEESDKFADQSPYPETPAIFDDIYWSSDNPESNDLKENGRLFFT